MSERREDDYQSWYDEAIVAANEAGYGPCTAADAIRGLAEERDHYKKLAEEGTAPLIKSMKLEDGHFDMSITGPIVEAFAVALVGQFKEGGSVNYMEMNLYDRDEPFQRYTVTVQKVGAKSPADLVNEARARITELEKKLSGCQWYWPENDTSSDACADNPFEVMENCDLPRGEVLAVSRGGVVETKYYAALPAADDAASDDDFEVEEDTQEAAEAAVAKELARRAAIVEVAA